MKIIFKCKTVEELSKSDYILEKGEICLIDFPDNSRKVVVGDGKTKCLDCEELKKFPKSIKLVPKRWVGSHHLKAVAKVDEDE
jgi:hypothetical protein